MDRTLLGAKIKQIRNARKMTAEKLSELCNVNSGHIFQIEAGLRLPSLPLFIRICEILQVSSDYLLELSFPELESDLFVLEQLNKLDFEQRETFIYLLKSYVDYKKHI